PHTLYPSVPPGVPRLFPTRRSSDLVAAALAAGKPRLAELADHLLGVEQRHVVHLDVLARGDVPLAQRHVLLDHLRELLQLLGREDRKSTRLNSSHQIISYAVFCLKK